MKAGPPLRVAIVGAGIAGLSCARTLLNQGAEVCVFEQSDVPGGRVATRRTEIGGFDSGAQYFTAREADFCAELQVWLATGVVARWAGRVETLPPRAARAASESSEVPERYVGTPGMASLATYLAHGLDVRFEQRVTRLETIGRGATARWAIQRAAVASEVHGLEVTEGLYDAVVLALPPALALEIADGVSDEMRVVRGVELAPSWTLMLGFGQALELPFDAAFVEGHRLGWLARDSSKPLRRSGERWIAQASAAWSREHYDDDRDDVRAKLTKAFAETTGVTVQPLFSAVHRWPHALPTAPLGVGFIWDDLRRIGLCGDWCLGARLEAAWLSGRRLAEAMRRSRPERWIE